MSDSAGGSEKDLDEDTPEELEEDSKEDSSENCNANNLSSGSKSSVNISEKNSTEKISTLSKGASSTGSAEDSSEQRKSLICLKIDGSFFHLISGADAADKPGTSYSCILKSTDAAMFSREDTPKTPTTENLDAVDADGNFLFVYRGSEEDLKEVVTRHSGGSEASQESMLSPEDNSVTPDFSNENVLKCTTLSHHSSAPIPKDSLTSIKDKEVARTSKQTDSNISNSSQPSSLMANIDLRAGLKAKEQRCFCKRDETISKSEESLLVVEESLLQEIEECLQKFFESTSSEEEKLATKLTELVGEDAVEVSSEELSLEVASKDSLEVANCDICANIDSDEDSDDNKEERHKVCLKKGCTNISCKKTKKVFFLCNAEDYIKLLDEEDEEDICDKDYSFRRKNRKE